MNILDIQYDQYDGEIQFLGNVRYLILDKTYLVFMNWGEIRVCLQREDNKVVAFDKNRNLLYEKVLSKTGQYRFGPKYGHRVKPVSEETDPVLKMLRSLRFSVNTPIFYASADAVSVLESIKDVCGYSTKDNDIQWVTDGDKKYSDNQFFKGRFSVKVDIENASYAFSVKRICNRNKEIKETLGSIYIWPGCDLEVLHSILSIYFFKKEGDNNGRYEFRSKRIESGTTIN